MEKKLSKKKAAQGSSLAQRTSLRTTPAHNPCAQPLRTSPAHKPGAQSAGTL